MKKILLICAWIIGWIVPCFAQQSLRLSLDDAITLANDSSLTAFRYRNMYWAGYWEFRTFQADRLPAISMNVAPRYLRYITNRYDSGMDRDVYREQQLFGADGYFSLTQNVDFLGGTFYMNSELGYMRNFGYSKSTQFSAVPLQVGYKQNLLGYNAFRWDKRIEPLKYEKTRKQFVYHMESISEEVAKLYFDLAMAQANCTLAQSNVVSSDTLYAIGERRFKIASISQADLLTLKLDKVNAENTLRNAIIARKRAMTALGNYLHIGQGTEIETLLPEHPAELFIPADKALALVGENNPLFLDHQQRILEAERTLDKTIKESRMNASFNASIGFNQVADNLGGAYRNLLQQDLVQLSVSVPLVDWGIRKGKKNMARNNLEEVRLSARQEEISLEEDVMVTVDEFNIQQTQIANAREAYNLAEVAYEQTQQRFFIGKMTVADLTLASNRRQEAQRNYILALQEYWQNYYKIRRMTLYDFEHGEPLTNRFNFNTGMYK